MHGKNETRTSCITAAAQMGAAPKDRLHDSHVAPGQQLLRTF